MMNMIYMLASSTTVHPILMAIYPTIPTRLRNMRNPTIKGYLFECLIEYILLVPLLQSPHRQQKTHPRTLNTIRGAACLTAPRPFGTLRGPVN
jgi:hypothetical protein